MLNPMQFQRYIQASAKRANLGVRWLYRVPPHTNGKEIVLPSLNSKATEQDYLEQLHYANHEVGHVLYTDFDSMSETKCDALRSFLGFIWNGLEDVRIESLSNTEYPGDRAVSDEVYEKLFGGAMNSLEKAKVSGKIDPTQIKSTLDKVVPVMWMMNEMNSDQYSSTAKVRPLIEKLLSPEAQERVNRIKAGDYADQMRGIRTIEDKFLGTKATFELAKRIFKEVFDEDPEKELERLKNPKPEPAKAKPKPTSAKPDKDGKDGEGRGKADKKDGEAEKQEGEGSKGEEGNEEGEGSSEEASMGGDDSVGDERNVHVTVDYSPFLTNAHEMKEPSKRSSPTTGMSYRYSNSGDYRTYTPCPANEFIVADFCKSKDVPDGVYPGGSGMARDLQAMLGEAGSTAFSNSVRTKLQVRSRDRYEYGVKRGRLHASMLHRVGIPDAHELQQKVFKRRIVNDTLDTAVIWLGDGSGSMSGGKFEQLVVATAHFNEAVGNVLQVPIEIHTFTDGSNGHGARPVMFVHRDFATRRLGQEELVRRLSIQGQNMRGNPDGDCILWSYDRLIRHKAKRKLLIVASDGSPACSLGGDIDGYTRRIVREIQDAKKVEIVGIGIMDNNVKRIYKEHYVINHAEELERALLTLLDKKLS